MRTETSRTTLLLNKANQPKTNVHLNFAGKEEDTIFTLLYHNG